MQNIDLCLKGDLKDIYNGALELQETLGFSISDQGITVECIKHDGDLRIISNHEFNRIYFKEPIHFFRGLGFLINSIRNNEKIEKAEKIYFDTNGIMFDVSRNAVLKTESVKEMLRYMAIMGLNMLMLYTEDTFFVKEEPYFGYLRGRYSHEEIKEIDDYAFSLGIELVPCIQTLAHLKQFLKYDASKQLRDTEDVLLVSEPRIYEFLENVIKSVSQCFRSRRINIGMDEASELGLGNYLIKNGYKDRHILLIEHLNKLSLLLDKYELKPMMWGDMFFKLGSKNHIYYDREAEITQDIIDKVPQNMQIIYWDYYSDDYDLYDCLIKKHKLLCPDNVLFAGGIWTWAGNCPHHSQTIVNSNPALLACKANGIREVIGTVWGDDGQEINHFTALLGMQLFAEHGYNADVETSRLSERFNECTGGDFNMFFDLCLPNEIDNAAGGKNLVNPSKYLLWQDPMLGFYDKDIESLELDVVFSGLAAKYETYIKQDTKFSWLYEFNYRLCRVLETKAVLGIGLKKAYDERNYEKLSEFANEIIPGLIIKVERLRQENYKMFFKTNKPFGWEVLDIRYGGLIQRLKTTVMRLNDYLNKEITIIDELEEDRLQCEEGGNKLGIHNQYLKVVVPTSVF
jgi:hexosaminidase